MVHITLGGELNICVSHFKFITISSMTQHCPLVADVVTVWYCA